MQKSKSKKKTKQIRQRDAKINIKDDEAVAKRKTELKSREARISHAPWWRKSKVEKEIAQEAIKGMKFKEIASQKQGKRDEAYYKKQAEWEAYLSKLKPNDRIPYESNQRRYMYKLDTYKSGGDMSDLKKDREAQLQAHLKKTPKMERWFKKSEKDVQNLQKQLKHAKTEKDKRKIERKISAKRKRMEKLQGKLLSFDDAQRFNSYRSNQARKQDEKKRANIVKDWRWVQAPDRFDYEGVDTPNSGRNPYIVNELDTKKKGIYEQIQKRQEKRHNEIVKLNGALIKIQIREQEIELGPTPHDIKDKKKREKALKAQAKEMKKLKVKKQKISEKLNKKQVLSEKAYRRDSNRQAAAQKAWLTENEKHRIYDPDRVEKMIQRSREKQKAS